MSSLLVIFFGVMKQFCRFWIWPETECKTSAEYAWSTIQIDTPHPPQPHTVCVYCTFSLGREGGQREGRGATVLKYRPWEQQLTRTEDGTPFLVYLCKVEEIYNSSTGINLKRPSKRLRPLIDLLVRRSLCVLADALLVNKKSAKKKERKKRRKLFRSVSYLDQQGMQHRE